MAVDFHYDTEQLIMLIGEKRLLWDKTHSDYKDRASRQEAWRDICSSLKGDFEQLSDVEKDTIEEFITKKWNNIRYSWRRFKRKQISQKSDIKHTTTQEYIFANHLKFLENVVHIPDPMRDDDESVTNDEDRLAMKLSVIDPDEYEQEATQNSSDDDPSTTIPLSSTIRSIDSGRTDHNVTECQDQKARLTDPLTESDRHAMFFKSIEPSLRTLSEQQTLDFQIGVLQLLKSTLNYE